VTNQITPFAKVLHHQSCVVWKQTKYKIAYIKMDSAGVKIYRNVRLG